MYTHTRAPARAYTHTHTHTHTQGAAVCRWFAAAHTHTRAYTHIKTHIHTRAHTHTHINRHTHTHARIHTHTNTHTHARTHACTHVDLRFCGCVSVWLSYYDVQLQGMVMCGLISTGCQSWKILKNSQNGWPAWETCRGVTQMAGNSVLTILTVHTRRYSPCKYRGMVLYSSVTVSCLSWGKYRWNKENCGSIWLILMGVHLTAISHKVL